MNHRSLLLILLLIVDVPALGQQIGQNKIAPGSVPANIFDAVPPVRETEIIDERPVIRDFRIAPEVPGTLTSPQGKTSRSGSTNAESVDKESAFDLLSAQKYVEEQHRYENLLQSNKSAKNYAGLAESLAMQNKIQEAIVVLREARAHNFADDANIAAVTGHVYYLRASAVSYIRYGLYLEASITLCKRALSINSHNQIALTTLKQVWSTRLDKAKEFEKNGDLVLAQHEYEELLKENGDDIEASSALSKLLKLRIRVETTLKNINLAFNEIPARTKVRITFDTAVNSDTSKVGDKFSIRTLEPIAETDGYVVLTEGSVIKGTVTKSGEWTSDRHNGKNGNLQLQFNTIEAPGRAPTPLMAQLVSIGGVIHGSRHGQNIAIETDTLPPNQRLTWLLAKQGKIIDVKVGDEFRLQFAEAVRVQIRQ